MSMTEKEEAELNAAVAQSRADSLEFSNILNSILSTAQKIESVGENLYALGMSSGQSLLVCSDTLRTKVESLRALDSRVLRREFERNQQASANMLNACLAGVEVGKAAK